MHCVEHGNRDRARNLRKPLWCGRTVGRSPPLYVKATASGLEAHMRAIACSARLGIILYDIPGRTGIPITDASVARLHESGTAIALKDANGDLSRIVRLRALCGPGFPQYAGDDALCPTYLALGGNGCVSGSTIARGRF